jgi:hypothetical protein
MEKYSREVEQKEAIIYALWYVWLVLEIL